MSAASEKQGLLPVVRRDALADIAQGLVLRVPDLAPESIETIARALHELLSGNDELSQIRRIGMQRYLRETAERHDRDSQGSDSMLTTEAAAELMQCSRPYVAMLIDHKKLAGASVTEDGHRRVPESSVHAWVAEREAKAKQGDYRAAAAESGMYDVPEHLFVENRTPRRS
ncbi:excisionase family DNA-binding protein [Massilia genomosp. 1]|uniref:Helix-turn-helix domain-containing protein n=1 Tax=Massilia genomosp. 1 TaxID=2609280 RepID=A0ABX0MFV5_9BURK|nr:excisionase family DNA-binding protein [Massilia genomosp. 1]NHZ61650.1 helix-turn-helix domain-containing protein [Massilia genomosp. 1]